jgi:LysM repeat protein
MRINNNKIITILLIIVHSLIFSQNQTPQEYINKWKEVAISKMNIHNIPASITLAQGILESGSGNSKLAKLANNHFGIKCHSSWTGETYYQDDDTKDECFRKYQNASQSYEDHAAFLKKKRYENLFLLDITDYKGWAKGLKKAGYATNPKYPDLLINLVEKYNLSQYDDINYINSSPMIGKDSGLNNSVNKKYDFDAIKLSTKHKLDKTGNSVPFIVVKQNDTYKKLEKEFGIRKWQVVKYNDLRKSHELNAGERIFLKPKRCKSKEEFHYVREGQTMRDISQLYGVKLKKLYKRNNLDQGAVPKGGQKIYLRKKKKI